MVTEISQKGLKHPYYLIKEGSQVIFVIPSGLNGVQFNKTKCLVASPTNSMIFQCLYGQGIAAMQRNDEVGEAKEFKVVTLSSGRQLEVAAGSYFAFVNVGRGFLVVLGPEEEEEALEKQGLVYDIVEKKGEIAFEQNPNYGVHPQISSE